MNNLAFASIDQLKDMLLNKEISHEELLQFFIDRFKRYDEQLGSALEIFDKKSILKDLKKEGVLNGIPGLIKDNICQEGRIVSCASKMLANYQAPYDATVIRLLKLAGAYPMGRANMDEFAMGSSTETSAFKKTCNPWDFSRVPGGSSGGSIAAVAAGLVPWALGSETGGSVRQPAAFCGVVGLKPTYGLISRYGLIAYASSLDQIGIATRLVKDNAHVLQVIAGSDPQDATTVDISHKAYIKALNGTIRPGLTIGIIENAINAQGIDSEVVNAMHNAVKELEKLGAQIKKITLPSLDYSAAVYFIISRAEAASNLARFDGVRYGLRDRNVSTLQDMYSNTRHDGFGKEVRARILMGNYVLSAGHASEFYANAKKVQRLMQHEMVEAFKEVDILVAPTHPAPAFKFGAFAENKLHMDLQDYFTCPMNITGMPAISVPCGFSSEGLPIGFQLIGNYFTEELLYQTAYAYEQQMQWYMNRPKYFLN